MKQTILLIEDNEQNRYLASFLLEKSGFRVFSAVDGLGGIAMARELVPDLILLDIQLPGMDGYEVARLLRQDEVLRRVPVVAVTSHAMGGDRQKAIRAGCDGYIEKPIDPGTFVANLRTFFTG